MKVKSVSKPMRHERPVRIALFGPQRVLGLIGDFLTHRRSSSLALVATLMLVGACTTTTVTPELVTKPTKVYDTVVVGDVEIEGELSHHLLPHFRTGLVRQLKEEQAFKIVLNPAPNPIPKSAILVTGRITEIDKGSAAARFLIGFGAGRAKARGTFAIHDASKRTLAKFQTWESYSGGAGIGGWDMVQMEELLERLGKETAKSVVRWSQGKDLKPPSQE